MYVCLCELTCATWVQEQRPEDIGSPGTRVTSGSELPDVGAGNWTRNLCKNSEHS